MKSIEELLRPLSARSVIASALLGTHPPRLPGRLLVALAGEFDIEAGTARVALSRMSDRGELVNHDGVYALTGALADRQARQDLGRQSPEDSEWDGSWDQAVVVESGRSSGDRHRLRKALIAARLGEVREGVWMRPANLERSAPSTLPAELTAHLLWFRVDALGEDAAAAVLGRMLDDDRWAPTADMLVDGLGQPPGSLAERFRLAAAALQHLTRDPLLPRGLQPAAWPSNDLRAAYRDYEKELQAELRTFFAAAT